AASLGLLFRRGDALQSLAEVNTIAFDKTGTLTLGQPQLTDFIVAPAMSAGVNVGDAAKRDLLALAAAAEEHSEHPIARALIEAAARENIALGQLESFEAIPGYGLTAQVSGVQLHIGADRLFTKLGIDLSVFSAAAQQLAEQGKT